MFACGIRNPSDAYCGIQNPRFWNPEYSSKNPESSTWSPQFPYIGRLFMPPMPQWNVEYKIRRAVDTFLFRVFLGPFINHVTSSGVHNPSIFIPSPTNLQHLKQQPQLLYNPLEVHQSVTLNYCWFSLQRKVRWDLFPLCLAVFLLSRRPSVRAMHVWHCTLTSLMLHVKVAWLFVNNSLPSLDRSPFR